MMATLWTKAQYWLLMLGASILVLAGAYVAGGRAASKARETKDLQNRIRTREAVDEISEKIHQMDATDLTDEFDKLYNRRR